MGWLIAALLALLVVSLLAIAMPALFGPVAAGVAPLALVVALIGLGAVWWRHAQHRVDPASHEASEPRDPGEAPVHGEDEGVET